MKNLLSISDLELVVSTLISGEHEIKINSNDLKVKSSSGEFLADHNKPSSFVLINFDSEIIKFEESELIIDFSEEQKFDFHFERRAKLFLNRDNSIRFMSIGKSNERTLKKLNSTIDEKHYLEFRILAKNPIFIEKQIRNLPIENYYVFFGENKLDRKINVFLQQSDHTILKMKIGKDTEQISAITREKNILSKLSFLDLNEIEFENEYYSKNEKIIILSHQSKSKDKLKSKELYSRYFSEKVDRSLKELVLCETVYWDQIINAISNLENKVEKQIYLEAVSQIEAEQTMKFTFSLGKLDLVSKYGVDTKLFFYDIDNFEKEAPLLDDFFILVIDEILEQNIIDNNLKQQFLFEKIKVYKIEHFLDDELSNLQDHFNLFVIKHSLKNQAPIILDLLFIIENIKIAS